MRALLKTKTWMAMAAACFSLAACKGSNAPAPAPLPAASNVQAQAGSAQILVTWSPVDGANHYLVNRTGGPASSGSGTSTGAAPASTVTATTVTPSYLDQAVVAGASYQYTVQAIEPGGRLGTASAAVTATTGPGAPAAPTGLAAAAVAGDATKATITWTAVASGVDRFHLLRGTTTGGPYANIAVVAGSATAPSFTDSGLQPGTSYFYVVQAANAAGYSPNSNEVSLLTPARAPQNVRVWATTSAATLSWSAVPGAAGYAVFRGTTKGGEGTTPITCGTGSGPTGCIDSGVTSGSTYYYTVAATNPGGTGAPSFEVGVTVPSSTLPAPTGVSATASASTLQIALSWTAVPGAASYQIARGTAAGGETPYASATGPSFIDASVGPGQSYFYTVQALTAGAAASPNSSEVSASLSGLAPPKPVGLTYAAGTTTLSSGKLAPTLTITWPATVGATSYLVYRFFDGGGGPALPGSAVVGAVSASGSTLSFTDAGQANLDAGTPPMLGWNTPYWYAVQAINAAGSSGNSLPVKALTLGQAPRLSFAIGAVGTVTLLFTATGTPGYAILRQTQGSTTWTSVGNPDSTLNAPGFVDGSVTPGVIYNYKVEAVNASGAGPDSNIQSGSAKLAAPTGLTVTGIATGGVSLSWTGVAGATEYQVLRSTAQGGEATPPVGITTGTSLVDNVNLGGGTSYYYVVVADNGTVLGTSDPSNEVSALTIPRAPAFLAVPGPAATQAAALWGASTGATSYKLSWGTTKGGPYTAGSTTVGITPPATLPPASATATGLTAAQPYYFIVQASNASGISLPSVETTATTTAAEITATDSVNYVPDLPPETLTPVDASSAVVRAWTITTSAAVTGGLGTGDGRLSVGLPSATGSFIFQRGNTYLSFTNVPAGPIDLGVDKMGRPNIDPNSGTGSAVRFNLGNMNSWNPPASALPPTAVGTPDDRLELFSTNTNIVIPRVNSLLSSPPNNGDTMLFQSQVALTLLGGKIDATATPPDQVVMTDVATAVTAGSGTTPPMVYQALQKIFTVPLFTGGPNTLYAQDGQFAAVPQTGTLAGTYKRSAFHTDPLRTAVHPTAVAGTDTIRIFGQPNGALHGNFAPNPITLLSFTAPDATSTDLPLGMSYGAPSLPNVGSTYAQFGELDTAYSVTYGSTTFQLPFIYRDVIANFNVGTATSPAMVPATALTWKTLAGATTGSAVPGGTTTVTGVGANPVLVWTAPTGAAPTHYVVEVRQVSNGSLVGRYYVTNASTQAVLVGLAPAVTYAATVWSVNSPSFSITKPNRASTGLYLAAPAITNPFSL